MNQKYSKIALLSLLYLIGLDVRPTIDNKAFVEGTEDVNSLSTIITEDKSILSDQERDEDDQLAPNRFSWKLHHQIDHSIYAGRSLMSSAHIERHDHDDKITEDTSILDNSDESNPLKTVDYVEREWHLMFRSLDLMQDSIASSILQQVSGKTSLLDEIVSRLKPECRRDINHVRESVKKHKLWALRMLDSNGKIPSALTYGRFASQGDYDECLKVRVDESVYSGVSGKLSPEHHKFHGKYCLIDFRLPLPEKPPGKLLSIHESVLDFNGTEILEEFPFMKNYSAYASVFYDAGYLHAFCLPSTCEVTDLTKSLGKTLEGLYIIVNSTVDCQETPDEPLPFRKSQILSLTLGAILFSNAIFASIMHYMLPNDIKTQKNRTGGDDDGGIPRNDEKLEETQTTGNSFASNLRRWMVKTAKQNKTYHDCFSIQTNFNRLTKPDPRGLTFVHYTRVVAMALTIITHTGALGTLQAITKPADAANSESIFRDFLPQMLANAFTSIQIFFFMAGFMLVISTYPSINREKGHLSFVEYLMKRAVRLMPGLAAAIGLNFLWPLFVDGPMVTYFTRLIVEPCETNWWRTMFFISNFDHVEKMCLRHSYFSASDYQLHLMAFPLLILLYKQPTVALIISGLLTVAGFAAQVIMVLTKPLLPFVMVDYIDKEAFFNVIHYIHHPVWNHMSAFFYGFIVGYLVAKQVRVNISATTSKRIWYFIIPAAITSIFAPYFWNHYKRPIHRWQMVVYVLFDRYVLLTACAWFAYSTMVLSRRPPAKKTKVEEPRSNINLPNIVTLEHDKPVEVENTCVGEIGTPLPKVIIEEIKQSSPPSADRLNQPNTTDQTTIPRQRSSPDFQISNTTFNKGRPLRPAVSSVNVSSMPTGNTSSKQEVVPKTLQNQDQPRKRAQPLISNVNTLCLMLSRLTFQLYLFNMVVLCIDVNHSKYNWFFSYYFIITKALAVYICSTILATIFFVTLESPCLTLYIMWVKSRAQSRANRCTEEMSAAANKSESIHVSLNPAKSIKISPDSASKRSELGSNFEGLCMRMGTPDPTKPSFSFIDSPPTSATTNTDSGIKSSDHQAKM